MWGEGVRNCLDVCGGSGHNATKEPCVVRKPEIIRKIALFLPSLCGGGAEKVMVHLAQGFSERGFDVDLILAKADGPYFSLVPKSVRIVDLKARRVLYSLPGLVRYLRESKPEALISALDHANVIALGAKLLSRSPVRLALSVHSTLSQSSARAMNLRGRLTPCWTRLFYPWADAVIAVSKGVADDLLRVSKLRKEKVHVIYNPVVAPELFVQAEEVLDHPWFAADEPPVILGVGRLTEPKDFITLIRAFAIVKEVCPARLIILGEGEERARLEAFVRNLDLEASVELPGFVSNPYKYIKRAAVFVLSSKWEGLPTVLIEALALGTPVISTDCPSGPAEILEGGRWGRLVPVGDVNALAQAILCALSGEVPSSPREASHPYELQRVVSAYVDILGL